MKITLMAGRVGQGAKVPATKPDNLNSTLEPM